MTRQPATLLLIVDPPRCIVALALVVWLAIVCPHRCLLRTSTRLLRADPERLIAAPACRAVGAAFSEVAIHSVASLAHVHVGFVLISSAGRPVWPAGAFISPGHI